MEELKTAIVTGAGKRVGAKIAAALLERGWTVVAHVHREDDEVPEGAVKVAADLVRPDCADAIFAAAAGLPGPPCTTMGFAGHCCAPASPQASSSAAGMARFMASPSVE